MNTATIERNPSLLQQPGVGMAVCDATKTGYPVLFADMGYEDVTGKSRREYLGSSLLQGYDHEELHQARELIAASLTDGKSRSWRYAQPQNTGNTLPTEVWVMPVYASSDNNGQFVVLIHKLTH